MNATAKVNGTANVTGTANVNGTEETAEYAAEIKAHSTEDTSDEAEKTFDEVIARSDDRTDGTIDLYDQGRLVVSA